MVHQGNLEELKVLNCFLANPGMYLDEIKQELFDKTGKWVSKSTICSEAKRMGLTRKKMRRIATQRSDIARTHFMVQVKSMSTDTFIWVEKQAQTSVMHMLPEGMPTACKV